MHPRFEVSPVESQSISTDHDLLVPGDAVSVTVTIQISPGDFATFQNVFSPWTVEMVVPTYCFAVLVLDEPALKAVYAPARRGSARSTTRSGRSRRITRCR